MPSLLISLWNSPEQLAITLRWLTIIGILSTGFFATAAYFVNDRIGNLQAEKINAQSGQITHQISEIDRLQKQSASLEQKILDSERGISDTYDFNGAHRQSVGAGRVAVTAGPEIGIFQTMMKLYNEKDWKGLKTVCDELGSCPRKWCRSCG